jgi:hypothetical protein
MKRWQKTLLASGLLIAAILLAHALLLSSLAKHDAVSRLLAGGRDVQPSTIVLIVSFFIVRVLAVLALPGLILARLGLVVMEALEDRRGQ